MIYLTYEEYKMKYYDTQMQYNEILNEKEELFAITQPKSVDFKKERVIGGNPVNTFDEYLINKEKKNIDQRLKEIKSILDDRQRLLQLKEDELRHSKNMVDRIYTYRYIDRLKIKNIALRVPCGEATVKRVLHTIKNNLKLMNRKS